MFTEHGISSLESFDPADSALSHVLNTNVRQNYNKNRSAIQKVVQQKRH